MTRVINVIDVESVHGLAEIVEVVRRTNESYVLRQDSEDVAILRPVRRSARKRTRKGQPTSADDPIWKLVGMADSGGPGDVSENKYKYLAEAHLHRSRDE